MFQHKAYACTLSFLADEPGSHEAVLSRLEENLRRRAGDQAFKLTSGPLQHDGSVVVRLHFSKAIHRRWLVGEIQTHRELKVLDLEYLPEA